MPDKTNSVSALDHACIHNLPHPRNRFFTGRGRILDAISRSLAAADPGATAIRAVYGTGGTGKPRPT